MPGSGTDPIYLSLGSNLGDRYQNIHNAVHCIRNSISDVKITLSPFYETEPWGNKNQPWFLNCVAKLNIVSAGSESKGFPGEIVRSSEPEDLLKTFNSIEKILGRERVGSRWEPRVIDIDILLYGERVVSTEILQIPHPRMLHRRFVLIPLADLDPCMVIPQSGMLVREALEGCTDDSVVYRYEE